MRTVLRRENPGKKLGLPNARFHDLSHTYATFALKSGDSPKTLQENLGHADVAFTLDVYGHVLEEMKYESASNAKRNPRVLANSRASSGGRYRTRTCDPLHVNGKMGFFIIFLRCLWLFLFRSGCFPALSENKASTVSDRVCGW